MASKRKKKKAPSSPVPAKIAPEDLLRLANEALLAGKHRDAIAQFKTLAKTDADPSRCEQGLIDAYRGRALELQAKGMDREALTIWENRSQVRPGLAPDPLHLALLFRLGRIAPALAGYQQLVEVGAPDELGVLRTQFAALYLATSDGLDALPPDDPVRRDGPAARAALAAYCEGQDDAATQALRAISFRSPYRDFATILKALLALAADPAAADTLLGRVTADSPFEPLAAAARLARLPEPAFLEALGHAGAQSRAFALTLRGWSPERVRLWQELSGAALAKDPLQMIGVLQRLRGRLGLPWVRRKMRTLLLSRLPPKPPPAVFAAFLEIDWYLITALGTEEHGDAWATVNAWRTVCGAIRGPNEAWPKSGSDDALRIALLQRRLAMELKLLADFVALEVEEELEHSLELDPEYLPGYLLLIQQYRGDGRLKEARRILAMAQKHWPEDTDLLNEALDVALAGDAFKKAAGLARQILLRDPINRRVRHSLWQAHVAHARKQWKKERPDLALKELEQALAWADAPAHRTRTELLQALFAFEAGTLEATALAAASEHAGPGAVGRFMLALEAEALGSMPRDVLKRAGLTPIPPLDLEGLLRFARLLREAAENPAGFIPLAVQPFHAVLKKAVRLNLDRAGYEALCETLHRADEFALCAEFAKAALKRWRGDPLFVLFAFQAKLADPLARSITDADIDRLENALDQAEDQGDTRTAMRIREALRHLIPSPFADPFSAPMGLPDDDEGIPFNLSPADMSELLDALQNTPAGENLRDMEKTMGRDAVLRMLQEISSDLPPSPPPLPKPKPKPQAGRGRKKASAAPPPDDSDGPDDDNPDQLKLF